MRANPYWAGLAACVLMFILPGCAWMQDGGKTISVLIDGRILADDIEAIADALDDPRTNGDELMRLADHLAEDLERLMLSMDLDDAIREKAMEFVLAIRAGVVTAETVRAFLASDMDRLREIRASLDDESGT